MDRKYRGLAALLLVINLACTWGYAQRTAETTPRVAELDAFHEVIATIWHEAWPKKDTALLQKLLPDVEKGIASVAAAPLPGILRDKKNVWDEGVRKLQIAGADYKAAAAAGDSSKLLAAAETLHSRFEELMRAIRPVLKEIDEFHAVLYMLYHHYVPKNDMENIRKSGAELVRKMEVLSNAKLPERLIDKEYDFQVARGLLSQSVEALQAGIASGNEQTINSALEAVHSRYRALEKVF